MKKKQKKRCPVAIQVMSTKAAGAKKNACLSCGLRICPGADGRKCLARRFTEAEWKAIQEVKEWV